MRLVTGFRTCWRAAWRPGAPRGAPVAASCSRLAAGDVIKSGWMAELLSLFPLPNVVLFPNVFLPLHIFEPRYRQMVADALDGDRIIGMVLLRPGWEGNYEGRPAVYPVGCAGLITHAERLPDGRYDIVLQGLEKFRILDEDNSRSYRIATVDSIAEAPNGDDREAMRAARR